ncbi:ArsR/SmtB family transcription factor [Bdellovibrio bacteriovorus]|uniref:ArsR/SmtB family transcription factor n=1 Tax=Bdellovibrio TaxID=958 RepID=UPI0035A99F53
MRKNLSGAAAKIQTHAPIFAALGDETRLHLVKKLIDGETHSISDLTEGSKVTRQAITKHLRVLQGVGLVESVRSGRETLFELNPQPLRDIQEYLDLVSSQWDQALGRLKAFVEK